MYITIVSILTLLVVLAQTSQAYATTNSTSNVNVHLESQIHKLIENPFFAPDGSCLVDAYQLHGIPADHQECPEGYGNNEDYTCIPTHEQCPDGYHSADDDETSQCYPETEPCYPGQIRYP